MWESRHRGRHLRENRHADHNARPNVHVQNGSHPEPEGLAQRRCNVFDLAMGAKSPATEVTENTEEHVVSHLNPNRLRCELARR